MKKTLSLSLALSLSLLLGSCGESSSVDPQPQAQPVVVEEQQATPTSVPEAEPKEKADTPALSAPAKHAPETVGEAKSSDRLEQSSDMQVEEAIEAEEDRDRSGKGESYSGDDMERMD